jgi:hypothetical protein
MKPNGIKGNGTRTVPFFCFRQRKKVVFCKQITMTAPDKNGQAANIGERDKRDTRCV